MSGTINRLVAYCSNQYLEYRATGERYKLLRHVSLVALNIDGACIRRSRHTSRQKTLEHSGKLMRIQDYNIIMHHLYQFISAILQVKAHFCLCRDAGLCGPRVDLQPLQILYCL